VLLLIPVLMVAGGPVPVRIIQLAISGRTAARVSILALRLHLRYSPEWLRGNAVYVDLRWGGSRGDGGIGRSDPALRGSLTKCGTVHLK
jgi:hypothetical protein